MKKLLSALIVAFMAVGFAACDSDKGANKPENIVSEYEAICEQLCSAIASDNYDELLKARNKYRDFIKRAKQNNITPSSLDPESQERLDDAADLLEMTAKRYNFDLDQFLGGK